VFGIKKIEKSAKILWHGQKYLLIPWNIFVTIPRIFTGAGIGFGIMKKMKNSERNH